MVYPGISALSQELPSRAELIEQVADDTRVMPGIDISRIYSAKKNSNRDKHSRVGRNRGESCRMGPRQHDTEGLSQNWRRHPGAANEKDGYSQF